MKLPIIGQEAICPDGLGRVEEIDFKLPNKNITIRTYVNNKSCIWDMDDIKLIPIPNLHDNLQTIIDQLDWLINFYRNN